MKKILLLSTLILVLGACTQNKTAGEYLGEGENNGKKYVLGDDAAVNAVKNVAKHYSSKDTTAKSILKNIMRTTKNGSIQWSLFQWNHMLSSR